MTDTYTVTAKRWEKGWELHIAGVGATQSRKLKGAEVMVRDLIHRRENVPADSFELAWQFEIGSELDAQVKAARAAVAESAHAQQEAAAKSRTVAEKLSSQGLAGYEVARVLGVSAQRVSQLLGSKRSARIRGLSAKR